MSFNRDGNVNITPCKNCADRHFTYDEKGEVIGTCHKACEKYAAFKEYLEDIRKAKESDKHISVVKSVKRRSSYYQGKRKIY